MGAFKKWDDGSVLDTDFSRADPLFYYLPKGDWAKAIGFKALPDREEWRSEQVQISVYPKYRPREAALSDKEREELYVRAIPALAKLYRKLKSISLNGATLYRVLDSGALTAELRSLGFEPSVGGGPNQATWVRERERANRWRWLFG